MILPQTGEPREYPGLDWDDQETSLPIMFGTGIALLALITIAVASVVNL